MRRPSHAVTRGFNVTPKPSSIHVRPMKRTVAGQMLRSTRGHAKPRPSPVVRRPHSFKRSDHSAMASQGQA